MTVKNERVLVRTDVSRATAQEASQVAEKTILLSEAVLGLKLQTSHRLVVEIFREEERYRRRYPAAGHGRWGHYDPGRNSIGLIFFDELHHRNALTHETAHSFFHQALPRVDIPPWLNEGFAEYVEFLVDLDVQPPMEGKAVPKMWTFSLPKWVVEGEVSLSLSRLMEFRQISANVPFWVYVEGGLLLQYLLSGVHLQDRERFGRFLKQLYSTEEYMAHAVVNEAFRACFEGDMTGLETRWRRWILGEENV